MRFLIYKHNGTNLLFSNIFVIEELDKKREIAINKKKRALLKDEVWKYGEEEDTIDYVLFRIRELTVRLI